MLFDDVKSAHFELSLSSGGGGGEHSQVVDMPFGTQTREMTGGASDNTNNAIVFGHSGLEWPSVDAPATLGPNGPWAAGASTLGHSRP